jgi:hypothetical protein
VTPLFFHTARSVLASVPESTANPRRLEAPLLVVIVVAAVTAALLRAIG